MEDEGCCNEQFRWNLALPEAFAFALSGYKTKPPA